MRRLAEEDGMISAFVAVLAVAIVAVAGLAYDGGQIIRATAEARDVAGAAARAGGQQLATADVHAGRAWLDEAAAEHAASQYLTATGTVGEVTVTDTDVRSPSPSPSRCGCSRYRIGRSPSPPSHPPPPTCSRPHDRRVRP